MAILTLRTIPFTLPLLPSSSVNLPLSRRVSVRCHRIESENAGDSVEFSRSRRGIILAPILTAGVYFLRSTAATAFEEEKPSETPVAPPPPVEDITARIYDATAIGEPLAVGKDKSKVWEKMMNARIVYLGEAEKVPIGDDKELELEIVKNLRKRCLDSDRLLSLALEIFPSDLQDQLDQFIDGRIDEETLKLSTPYWPPERWQEYAPLLSYCRENKIRLVACGAPLEVLRTVQAEGIHGLSKADREKYYPPAGSRFISGFNAITRRSSKEQTFYNQSLNFETSSYFSVQAKAVEDYTMSQVILQAVADGGASGLLVVVTGASHVMYGARGKGIPARISNRIQKKSQIVILLDPERQSIRREGEVPVADFLWYSAARPCSRNCFDRAEIARVMNAGRRRDALPQDLQKGLDLGLVSPEVLQNFFDLEQYPILSELTHRYQGFRERLLADPKFLHKLAIEESISITTTLLAQYEKRKENFFAEIDYVITDTLRGAVVDFFTVWLPAPTLSFLSFGDEMNMSDNMESLKGLLGSIPDNAFQTSPAGKNWNITHRVAALLVGGLKLSGVGFVSSIGAVAASNTLFALRKFLNPELMSSEKYRRSPILKTAAVYSGFLGISANLRYQVIAGLVELRLSELIPSQTLLVNMISFGARTINSYWGTQQWIDLARYTGLQTRKTETPPETPDLANCSTIECPSTEDTNVNDLNNQ